LEEELRKAAADHRAETVSNIIQERSDVDRELFKLTKTWQGAIATAIAEVKDLINAVIGDAHAKSLAAVESAGRLAHQRLEVELTTTWQGEPADIRQIGHLQQLAVVSIHGVPIDADTLAVLGSLKGVQRIDLFGTGAGPAEARRLAERLPDARIDVRRGGRLGVSSTAFGGPCEIRTVEPGSAADQAGLRSGDVVLSIDGTDVASFDELTARLGECAPGEVVRLSVARHGGTADGEPERIECQVRLDAW
jgi:membrane-associated protease RseP (regulator of RpoE activity)